MDFLPKTLIFALNEAHATNIVQIAKEVFGRTDDRFVQKITYSAGDSNELIRQFRNDKDFRIAVTCTLVATGTDVKPLEVVMFMRDVESLPLYIQMKGRGVRTIGDEQLRNVTPNAFSKDCFYLVDAVGVTEHAQTVAPIDDAPTTKTITLKELLERISHGYIPDEYLKRLAATLARIYNKADDPQRKEFVRLSLMSSAKYNFNGNLVAGMRPNTSPNANLSWEKNNTVNVGLDVGLFRNALNLNFEYYVSKTSDMLLEVPVPAYSGYSTSLQNVGSVRNKGFEFAASFKNHIKDFNYQISANFSTNKNTVLSLGANQNEIITARNITKVGHPIGALYGYRIIGIFENEEQLKSLPNYRDSQKVGDYIFKNIDDSDNTITEKDREIIGNPHPEFTYGGNIQLFYKNFDLGITIQGVYGVDVINRDLPTTILSSEIWSVMSKEYYNNRWISPDKPGKYAKAGSNSNTLSRESDLMMQDGSFFRIRDISLGYTLDKKWLTRTFLTNVRVYVSVKNPLLVSKYMGLNPESEGSSNPLNAGVTLGQYPAEKNFVVGASISF
jgi:hypothetical protein